MVFVGDAVSVSWAGGECFAVPVSAGFENSRLVPRVDFPFGDLDGAEDLVREALAAGVPLRGVIEELVGGREFDVRCEAARYVLAQIVGSRNWLKAALELCVACGLADQMGWTQPELARRLGISKQALQQGVKRVRLELGLRKTGMMRGEAARGKMARRNFRHFVAEGL